MGVAIRTYLSLKRDGYSIPEYAEVLTWNPPSSRFDM